VTKKLIGHYDSFGLEQKGQELITSALEAGKPLQGKAMNSLNGLLSQLSQISIIAQELFEEVLQNSKKTFDRMANIRNRADKIIEKLPVVENYVFNNSQNFYKNGGYQLTEDKLNGLFRKKDERNINKENVPIAIKNQYETCVKIPDFSLLHEYHQNGNCSKDYSNPDFFILEWAKEELAKQKKSKKRKEKENQKKTKRKKTS